MWFKTNPPALDIIRGRSREIGIRTALGARTGDVLRLVIVEGMTPTLVGIAVGVIVALLASVVPAYLAARFDPVEVLRGD